METKALLGVEWKDEAKGEFEAVFATFNELDSDGDITLPGAFEDGAKVRISAFGHASWGLSRGASTVPMPPTGKGIIRTSDAEAAVLGQFFLKTTAGRDAYEQVKAMDDLQEWSYGYDIVEDATPTPKQKAEGATRILVKQLVHEISPVLLGAGTRTRTVAIKGKQLSGDLRMALDSAGRERWKTDRGWIYVDDFDLDEGWAVYQISADNGEQKYLRVPYSRSDDGTVALGESEIAVERTTTYRTKDLSFPDEAAAALGGVKALVARVEGWGSGSDRKEGRVLSAANRERLTELSSSLGEASKALDELLSETDPDQQSALADALDIEAGVAKAAARLRL